MQSPRSMSGCHGNGMRGSDKSFVGGKFQQWSEQIVRGERESERARERERWGTKNERNLKAAATNRKIYPGRENSDKNKAHSQRECAERERERVCHRQ